MKARHLAIGAFLLALIVPFLTASHGNNRERDIPTPVPVEPEYVEEVEKGNQWFMFQRAYPFDSVPSEARLRAWESRPVESSRLKAPLAAQAEWQSLGPNPTTSGIPNNWGATSGRITSIAISPADPQLVIIGGASGGIWRSTDGGSSFIPVSDDQVDLAVGSIAFCDQNPAIVYAGMGDDLGYLGSGVLKSTNGGQTWSRVTNSTLPSLGSPTSIKVDPADPSRVYLGLYSMRVPGGGVYSGALYVSTDGGANWSARLPGLARDLAISPSDPHKIYLATSRVDTGGQPPGLYRSTDGGSSWSNLFATPYDQGKTVDVKLAVVSDQIIYVYTGGFISGAFEARVVLSTDGGATWQNRGSSGLDTAQFGYNTYITAAPGNPNSIYVGTRDVFKSSDGGTSYDNLTKNLTPSGSGFRFTPATSTSHIDQHALAFAPGNQNIVYIGNDGGLSRSTDGGTTFSSLNSTLSLSQMYGIAIDPVDPTISYVGTQDNGMQRRAGAPFQWQELITGDFKTVVTHPQNDSIVTNYVGCNVYRFTSRGDHFDRQVAIEATFGEPSSNPRVSFLAPLVGTRVNPTLLFGTWRLFVSPDFGNTWQAPGGTVDLTRGVTQFGPDVLSAIGVGTSNQNVIYTGSEQGRAMVTANGGSTWTDVTPGLPDRSITAITVDDANSAVAYVCLSGFGAGHVFKTTDNGNTWSDQSGNLPDIPVNALAIDSADSNTLSIGTDIGIYRSSTGGGSWVGLNDGLPPVVVRAIVADPRGFLQAATYGRGASQFGTPVLQLPVIDLVTSSGKKLTISGQNFGSNPHVIINDVERNQFITGVTQQLVSLKGKPKKLGLVTGNNSIKITTAAGESNVFTLLR